jgi:hypothetical protein
MIGVVGRKRVVSRPSSRFVPIGHEQRSVTLGC